MKDVFQIWVYLATPPLLWLTVTLGAYLLAERIAVASGYKPLLNPVLLSVVMIVVLLRATATEYETYFAGAQFVHFMLGPATVALVVPLVREARLVRRLIAPILAALIAGSFTAIASTVGIAWALGASRQTLF